MRTTQTITWITTNCSECGVNMAMTQTYYNARIQDRRSFYCLNGHKQHYPGQTAEQKLEAAQRQAEYARTQARAVQDQLDATRRSLAATKGVLTKTRKRIGNGACPCCNRHFKDVERHMANKHPDYDTVEA